MTACWEFFLKLQHKERHTMSIMTKKYGRCTPVAINNSILNPQALRARMCASLFKLMAMRQGNGMATTFGDFVAHMRGKIEKKMADGITSPEEIEMREAYLEMTKEIHDSRFDKDHPLTLDEAGSLFNECDLELDANVAVPELKDMGESGDQEESSEQHATTNT